MTAHAYTPAEVERIARQLGGARKNGGGWDCRCPAHDDQEPSLSLSVGEDGRLLWCCHTGCDQAAVLDGLKKRGVLMNGDAREAEPKAAKGRIVATYDYTDEHGGLLFQAVRYQPKRLQAAPTGRAWRLGVGPRGRPPRPLSPARGAGGRRGLVVEGEKDADRLRALGFVATTNPQGAGKWRPEYAEALAGKRVVILPDNDEAGRKHAGKVAASLRGKAASVKVLELAGPAREGRRLGLARRRPHRRRAATADREGRGEPAGLAHRSSAGRRRAARLRGQRRDRAAPRARAGRPAPVRRAGPGASSARPCRGARARAGAPWTDNDDTALAIWLQHQGVRVKPATCAAAVQLVAADHPHHPVRTYLEGLRWDGTPRLDDWLETYLGATAERPAARSTCARSGASR